MLRLAVMLAVRRSRWMMPFTQWRMHPSMVIHKTELVKSNTQPLLLVEVGIMQLRTAKAHQTRLLITILKRRKHQGPLLRFRLRSLRRLAVPRRSPTPRHTHTHSPQDIHLQHTSIQFVLVRTISVTR
jgi:hypothetical protein